MMMCASCGVKEDENIKLKNCTACYLVKYCSIKCQKDHRRQHKRDCKKRAAELHDELLFKQPESIDIGDCPICCLPLPLDQDKKSAFMMCCGKFICIGCDYANQNREISERRHPTCPFCRNPAPDTQEEQLQYIKKRIEANDPGALTQMGCYHNERGDHKSAFEYWSKAVGLGAIDAHYHLSCMYLAGDCVEKDTKKVVYHSEVAAIGGHPKARYNLAGVELEAGRIDRAVKHHLINAKLGLDESLDVLKMFYKDGFVSKDDFAAALRAHQAAVDATKSPLREEAAVYLKFETEYNRREEAQRSQSQA